MTTAPNLKKATTHPIALSLLGLDFRAMQLQYIARPTGMHDLRSVLLAEPLSTCSTLDALALQSAVSSSEASTQKLMTHP